MIIAIPLSRGRLSTHFTKAQEIAFFDESGKELAKFTNPALGGNCRDKKAMRDLIMQQGTGRVIVQQIGQRMLAKLLDSGLSVSRGESSLSITSLIELSDLPKRQLTQVSDGRPSLKHEAKGGCGGSSHDGEHSGCCSGGGCGQRASAKPTLMTRLDASAAQAETASFSGFRPVD